ncbi:MAG TPA: GAF domain-containing protein, partial [Roseiflexaceae bacterium]|nr:GAF domain-containing protein [Roseiflexaceae bacterium]
MEATSLTPPSSSFYDRWRMLGGDRFYAIARWMVLVLLIAVSKLLVDAPFWPPSPSMPPFQLVLWAYAVFTLLSTLALFLPALGALLSIAFYVDLAITSLLLFFSGDAHVLFYPLYFLPLVGASLRTNSFNGLIIGILTALSYIAAYLIPTIGPNNGRPPRDTLELVALLLRSTILVAVPWLASGLVERWGIANRHSVALAEQKTEQAWSDANITREQMRSLYEVAYTLSTTMNYNSVLDVALTESRKLAPSSLGLVLLSTGQPDELYVAASFGVNTLDTAQRIQLGKGPIGQALRVSDPCVIENIGQQDELRAITALPSCRSGCLVPLRAGLRTFGMLLLASDRPNTYGQEQLGMLAALANYAI